MNHYSKRCWYNVNIDTSNAFKSDWKWPELINNSMTVNSDSNVSNIFNLEWLELMSSYDIHIKFALFFNSIGNWTTKFAHVDMSTKNPEIPWPYSFNWVIGGENSDLVWYDSTSSNNENISIANTPYNPIAIDNLKEIDRCAIRSKLTLVRTDIPHAAWVDTHQRQCISLRTKLNYSNWENIINHLRHCNILIER